MHVHGRPEARRSCPSTTRHAECSRPPIGPGDSDVSRTPSFCRRRQAPPRRTPRSGDSAGPNGVARTQLAGSGRPRVTRRSPVVISVGTTHRSTLAGKPTAHRARARNQALLSRSIHRLTMRSPLHQNGLGLVPTRFTRKEPLLEGFIRWDDCDRTPSESSSPSESPAARSSALQSFEPLAHYVRFTRTPPTCLLLPFPGPAFRPVS